MHFHHGNLFHQQLIQHTLNKNRFPYDLFNLNQLLVVSWSRTKPRGFGVSSWPGACHTFWVSSVACMAVPKLGLGDFGGQRWGREVDSYPVTLPGTNIHSPKTNSSHLSRGRTPQRKLSVSRCELLVSGEGIPPQPARVCKSGWFSELPGNTWDMLVFRRVLMSFFFHVFFQTSSHYYLYRYV